MSREDLMSGSDELKCLFARGDFERFAAEAEKMEVREETAELLQVLQEKLKLEEQLREMGLQPLREEYYKLQPSKEYSDGQYAEVYAADHFIRNFGPSRATVMQGIRTLQSSGSTHEQAMGYAYEAYFNTQNGRWLMGAQLYIQAAAKRQDHAFYYGYAGRAFAKHLRLPGVKQDAVLWFKAAILQSRAISLDGQNARWHYYQALNLRNLAVQVNFMGYKETARLLLSGSKAEMKLAETVLREDQVAMGQAIDREKVKQVNLV